MNKIRNCNLPWSRGGISSEPHGSPGRMNGNKVARLWESFFLWWQKVSRREQFSLQKCSRNYVASRNFSMSRAMEQIIERYKKSLAFPLRVFQPLPSNIPRYQSLYLYLNFEQYLQFKSVIKSIYSAPRSTTCISCQFEASALANCNFCPPHATTPNIFQVTI